MYLKLGQPYIDLINYLQSFTRFALKKKIENWDLLTPFKYQLAGCTSEENKLSYK